MKKKGLIAVAALWCCLAAAAWFLPSRDISEAERRKLTQFPKLNAGEIISGRFMSEFEKYSQDQFPLRDLFRQIKARFHYNVLLQKDNNGIYFADGYACELGDPVNDWSVDRVISLFDKIYTEQIQPGGSKVYLCPVPDKGYFLGNTYGYPSTDYEALFGAVRDGMPWAQYVEITGSLELTDYYRTDTHWRHECILPAAQVLCDAMGVSPLSDYREEVITKPFRGVYCGQSALPLEPEEIRVLTSDLLDGCTVENLETGKTTKVYDMDKLDSRDLYDVYLSGATAFLTIDNPAAATDRELVVFRDSFGSSMIPLLLTDYRKVTVVDLRYIASDVLPSVLEFHGQDVLLLYSALILNNSASLK